MIEHADIIHDVFLNHATVLQYFSVLQQAYVYFGDRKEKKKLKKDTYRALPVPKPKTILFKEPTPLTPWAGPVSVNAGSKVN